jgi:hypothetical protein
MSFRRLAPLYECAVGEGSAAEGNTAMSTAAGSAPSTAVVVRYQTRPDAAERNQELVRQVFAELNRERPDGLRYAAFRLADGVSFVHVVTVEAGVDPLSRSAAFAEFQRELGGRLAGPPVPSPATMVGSYRFGKDDD